jgi:hypothetical protein
MENEPKQKKDFDSIVSEYNEKIDQALKFNFLVRASELQTEQAELLSRFKNQIKNYKYQAIQRENEDIANIFFHFQCVLNSIISALKMWVSLKEEDYQKSWSLLVDAQEYAIVAIRASDNHYGINNYIHQLEMIEKTIFPGWNLFNSSGFIETCGDCSVCGQEYGNCDHLEGLVYMGTLCRRVNRKVIELNHTAIVEVPHDRRCIVTKISTDEGKMRDYMTWNILDESAEIPEDSIGTTEGIIFTFDKLDFD